MNNLTQVSDSKRVHSLAEETVEIRVCGTVQGVGFRPTVWRLAQDLELGGEVCNDAAGVLIKISGSSGRIADFLERLQTEAPPLSRIEAIETRRLPTIIPFSGFEIIKSVAGENLTRVAPDAATCSACLAEVFNPLERRYRYPFTNCTHCGPRLSIVKTVPYDRHNTTMSPFPLCADCGQEYDNPADRRFHAQPIACPVCGPRVWLEQLNEGVTDGRNQMQDVVHRNRISRNISHNISRNTSRNSLQNDGVRDDLDRVAALIRQGKLVAIRGLGGFHLACDATNPEAVTRLRQRKRRYGKPFALMARDVAMIRRYCTITPTEQQLLESLEAPIVLLKANGASPLPESVAPGLTALGFMLPYTPLHCLILAQLDFPVVMTSGNLSEEPQIIGNDEARTKLKGIADWVLCHDRDIANRIDDSVVRVVDGIPRLMRRARGYAPSALPLPPGFENAPDLLAYGGELKATFCLVKNRAAVLSQHQGDLEHLATFEDYQKTLKLYQDLYDHQPQQLVADLHPEYLSTKLAQERAQQTGLPLILVQHHHAHVASCLAENNIPLNSPPVLGIALDGLGFGTDGTLWGGEFLLANYCGYKRLAAFKPIAMIGGAQAIREPWRNTYAHLHAALGWATVVDRFPHLDLCHDLAQKPLATIDQMLHKGINVPLASSCGRLFDAVAAALGLVRDRALFEGQGAIELEMNVDETVFSCEEQAYPFTLTPASPPLSLGLLNREQAPDQPLLYLDPTPMWEAVLSDLHQKVPIPVMAARFHNGLAQAITAMVQHLLQQLAPNQLLHEAVANSRLSPPSRDDPTHCSSTPDSSFPVFQTVALSGGCFQNKLLLEAVTRRVEAIGLRCLSQAQVPSNDGGLALGQAAIAAARQL